MQAYPLASGVIVADNDSLLRGILRSMLVPYGLSVFLAADGVEAVAFAQRMRAQLVILDLDMPGLNGLCACEQIRLLPGYAEVPIAILTAYDDAGARAACRRAGATTFFAKPFRPVDLLRGIAPFVAGSDQRISESILATPASQVWKRHSEPTPVYGEAPELAHGRKVLDIYRR